MSPSKVTAYPTSRELVPSPGTWDAWNRPWPVNYKRGGGYGYGDCESDVIPLDDLLLMDSLVVGKVKVDPEVGNRVGIHF